MNGIVNMVALVVAQLSLPIPVPHVPSLPVPIPNSIPIPPLQRDVPTIDATSGHALVQVPELDGFNPQNYRRLADVPRGPNGFDIGPGAFEMLDLSFCLNVGLHAPGTVGYYVAPLSGSRADIVRAVLNRWNGHPEIAQSNVQLLLWAITSKAHISTGGSGAGAAAQALLTAQEISNLNGGALAVFSNLLSRLGGSVPAPLQQVLNAQNQVRDLISHGNASYQQIARIAAPAGNTSEGVRSRWSYDPAGYFIRYLPQGFSLTTIQIYLPHPYSMKHDGQGRLTSIADDMRDRIDIAYTGASPVIRFHRPVGFEYIGDRSFPIRMAAGSLGNPAAIAAALRSAAGSLRAYDRSTVLSFAQDLNAAAACKAHGGCAPGDPPYDPTSQAGVSAGGKNQPLGQSGKPAPADKNKDCAHVRAFIEDAKRYRNLYYDPGLEEQAKKYVWELLPNGLWRSPGDQFQEAQEALAEAHAASSGGHVIYAGLTNMETCQVELHPDDPALRAAGFTQPEIDAMATHEAIHTLDCEKAKSNPQHDTWQWRQTAENHAYNEEIAQLERWLAENC